MRSGRDPCRTSAVEYNRDLSDVLLGDFERVQQRSAGNDGGPMLIIMEYGDFQSLPEHLFDVEALGRLDVFEVDPAKGGLQQLADLDDLVRIAAIDLNIENVDIS